jgi:hypothetical protein
MFIVGNCQLRLTRSATADIEVTVFFEGTNGGGFNQTVFTSVGTGSILASSVTGNTAKRVTSVVIRNTHATDPNDLEVLIFNGGAIETVLWTGTLLAGQGADYEYGRGWDYQS